MTATTIHSARPTRRATVTRRRFIARYMQLLVAGFVGMSALMLLPVLARVTSVEALALLMATSMTAGMAAWMAFRHHTWRAIAEMGLAMHLAFAVLFPAYWVGALSVNGLMLFGHVLMLPAIAIAMLRRREEYVGTR
jgi:flagellar biosynthetic protein FliP